MAVARVLARAQHADSARAELARARVEVGRDRDLQLSLAYDEAYVQLLLGKPDVAVRRLAEYVEGKPHLRGYLRKDVQFRPLWGRRDFQAIFASQGPTPPITSR